jgi:hypothetical protein
MDPQGATTDPASSGLEILMDSRYGSYLIWDNYEVVNWYTFPDTSSGSHGAYVFHVSSAAQKASYITIENMYVHHWINPFISIGTGNITSGSCVITNYVPYSYSPSPTPAWVSAPGGVYLQALPQGTDIPEGNSSPAVTAISGSNPYSITFTNTTGCSTKNYTDAVIQIGLDAGIIIGGNSAGDTGTIVQNNVFDGSDTAEVQWNPPVNDPAFDCTSNNQACMASVEVGRQGPQIWRNNVMRYVSNGFIGTANEMSGNLIEYLRLGTNPTGHTNAWESLVSTIAAPSIYFNNVIRHINWVTATGIPGGAGQIGVPLMISGSNTYPSYTFNNVLYDMTQNTVIEVGSGTQTAYVFNNTVQGGPASGASYQAFSCPSGDTCYVENNHAITSSANPLGTCGSTCTQTTNKITAPTTVAEDYYTSPAFYFSPQPSTSMTGGTNAQALCAQLEGISSAAYAACQGDTSYAVLYCQTNHTATVAMRRQITRPATGTVWNVGAYQGASGPPPPCQNNATVTVQ